MVRERTEGEAADNVAGKSRRPERPPAFPWLWAITVFFANIILIFLTAADLKKPAPGSARFASRELFFRVKRVQRGAAYDGRADSLILQTAEQPGIRYADQVHCISPFSENRSLNPLQYFWHLDVPGQYRILPPIEMFGDGITLIPALAIEQGRLVYAFFDLKGNRAREFLLPSPSVPIPAVNDTLFSSLEIADLDGDGNPVLLAGINGQFSGLPRGLLAYDARTGRKEFEFLIGALPYQTRPFDLNGDGKKEIVLSAWAPHNGLTANGVDDDHSFLFVLDPSGKILWKKTVGEFYTKVSFDIADVNGDGRQEIVTARACHRAQNPDPGEIIVFDAWTGAVSAQVRFSNVSFSEVRTALLGRKGSPRIVVGDSLGGLRILDGDLHPVAETRGPGGMIVLGTGSLGRDPSTLIFACSKSHHFLIYNDRLKELFRLSHKEIEYLDPPFLLGVSDGRDRHLVYNADKLYLISRPRRTGLDAAAAVLLSAPSRDFLLLILINLLAFGFFRASIRLGRIRREAERMDEAETSVSLVQEILHRLKSPLFTVQLEAEKLAAMAAAPHSDRNVGEIARVSRSIREDVKIMNRLAREIMQLVRPRKMNRKEADLGAFLREAASRYLRHQDGRVEYRVDVPDEPLPMAFDADRLREALDILIENALEAMPEGGRVRLAAYVMASPASRKKTAVLEVEDTGIGISEERRACLFKPFQSTKKDGLGLGLSLARRIVEDHGGSIEVHSREGVGTRIALSFPWKGRNLVG